MSWVKMGAVIRIGSVQTANVRLSTDIDTDSRVFLPAPTKGAISTQATTISATPMNTTAEEVWSIRDSNEPAGK